MSTTDGTIGSLSSLLGESLVSERQGKIVVSPSSTHEVSLLTRYADENNLGIEIAGARTKRGWIDPIHSAITLDMTRLAGIREHVWQDLTTSVAAGTTWASLQQALAVQSQRIALDPLWPAYATVGGIIATNDSGSLRTTYGSLRDLIIGMTVVLADGTIARTGGKVVKNVAGYDLHKLMTGSFGTLGVITEVTFRLHPTTKASASWTITSETLDALERCRRQIVTSALSFEALQLRTCKECFALDVSIVSLPECMEDLSQSLHGIAGNLTMRVANADVWLIREHSFIPESATVKLTLSPTRITAFLSEVKQMGGEGVAQQCGILTATLPADPEAISGLREKATAQSGSLTVLHWPANAPSRPDIWGPTGSSFALMQEIKRRFDPNRTINRGCFVGGL